MKSKTNKRTEPATGLNKPLTKAEEQVMWALWKLEKGFLKDVLEATPEPRPHPNTVATLLKILVEKGYVAYEVQGRNNIYKPLITKVEYGKKSINQLVKGYFEGSPGRLVSQFISDNRLTLEELEALLQQIRSSKNQL
jgi:predicted transcriptional regulator